MTTPLAVTDIVPTPSTALLVLLVVGHVLGDFLLQTRHAAEAKTRGSGYLKHGMAVWATHLIVLVPLMSTGVVLLVTVVTLFHVGIDWCKASW